MVEQQIEEILAALRPMIAQHGGDIQLLKYVDGVVYVKMLGACIGCPSSMYTLKLGIEESLKAKLSEVKEVIAL